MKGVGKGKKKLEHVIYLSTDRSCKCCIADIAIQTARITVHHRLLALSWPKTKLKNSTLGRGHNKQKLKEHIHTHLIKLNE